MTTEWSLAREILQGRIHTGQEPVLLRDIQLARRAARRQRRNAARSHRTG
ncbi:MAG: hypothetical protein Q7J48_18750 [Nocardioides sp.]|nr:hypothetical protein [Nocardioides sp.]